MNFYKCGHPNGVVVLTDNLMSLFAYYDWKDSAGFDGNKSQCWECWCKEGKK